MARVLRWPALVAALAASAPLGCAAGHSAAAPGEPPRFVRFWGAFRPEERHRDVIECSDAAREAIAGDASYLGRPPGEAARAMRERVIGCMKERGWGPAEIGTPASGSRV